MTKRKKSGRHVEYVVRDIGTLKGRIDSMCATCIVSHETHGWLIKRMQNDVWFTDMHKRLPEYGRTAVQAYWEGKVDMIGRYLTVFAYDYDGVLHQTHLDRDKKDGVHVNWPLWDERYKDVVDEGNASFTQWQDEHCQRNGAWWPDGKPFSVYPYRKSGLSKDPLDPVIETGGTA